MATLIMSAPADQRDPDMPDKGHILIDTAPAKAAPSVLANIRTLGFDPKDVKFLLTSHEHIDHVGGIAAIKAATGATLIARAEAISGLETARWAARIRNMTSLRLGRGQGRSRDQGRRSPSPWPNRYHRHRHARPHHGRDQLALEELRRQEMPVHRLCRQHQRGVSGRLSVQRSSRLDRGVPPTFDRIAALDAISADAASGGSGVRAAVRRGTSRLPRPVRAYAKTGHERLDARLAKEKTAKS